MKEKTKHILRMIIRVIDTLLHHFFLNDTKEEKRPSESPLKGDSPNDDFSSKEQQEEHPQP